MNKAMRGICLAAGLVLPATSGMALAQTYPTHPITLIVPAAAAGPADVVARVIAAKMSEILGQSLVIENNGGAGGYAAAVQIAHARPDGYSLLYATAATYLVLPQVYKAKGFDPFTQFVPAAMLATVSSALFVNKDLPVHSVAELVAYARASPNRLNFGTPGIGSNNHLTIERFKKAAGFEATHVPFRGGAPVIAALLAGEIQFSFDAQSTLIPYYKSGSVRVLALADDARGPFLPDVPTMEEAGYPGFFARSWHAIVAPAGTPADVVEKIRRAAAQAVADPQVVARLNAMQTRPAYQDAAGFLAVARDEAAAMKPVVEAAGITPD